MTVIYNGVLQSFTVVHQHGQLMADVYDKENSKQLGRLPVLLPPSAPLSKEPLKFVAQLIERGFYFYIRNQIVCINEGLCGGMKRASYIARDWSSVAQPALTLRGHQGAVTGLFSLQDGTLASGSSDKTIKIWDPKSEQCLRTLTGHHSPVETICRLQDGALATGSDNTIIRWDLNSGSRLQTFTPQTGKVETLIQIRGGSLVSGSMNDLWIWDPQSGAPIRKIQGHSNQVSALCELEEGSVASGSYDNTIKLWDSKLGKCLQTFTGHTGWVFCLIQLQDKTLASGSYDTTIKIWDPKTGTCLKTLTGHQSAVRTLFQLMDGTLASGSGDATIKLWSPKSGMCLATLRGHSDWVISLTEQQDGTLVSGSADQTIQLWKTEPLTQKAIPLALTPKLQAVRNLLSRYRQLPKSDTDYCQKLETWVLGLELHYKANPQDPGLATTLKELQTKEQELNSYLAAPLPLDPHFSAEEMFQQKLQQFTGVAEETFRAMQQQYAAKGETFFADLLRQQEETLQKTLEQKQSQISADLTVQQKQLYKKALAEALQEQKASLTSLSDAQLQQLQKSIDLKIGPQLQQELQTLFQSQQYQQQMQALQETVLNDIYQRQIQLTREMIDTQREQEGIKDVQSVLYQAYETKKQRLQEQQNLQSPPSVQAFYNTTEKHFSSKLMSAMMLVSGMIAREDTTLQKGTKIGSKTVEALCGSIPLVGSVVGSVLSFGIETGVDFIVGRSQDKNNNNTFDSAIRFKDAMALAELASRRATQHYLDTIQTLTPKQAAAAGKKAAHVMYNYLRKGDLKAIAHRPQEEKIEALVKAVEIAAQEETGVFEKRGRVFETPLSPARLKQFDITTKNVQGLEGSVEFLLKGKEISSPMSSITTGQEQQKAILRLKAKVTFSGQKFEITRNKKDLTLTVMGAKNDQVLKQIETSLVAVFDSKVIEDCEINSQTLNVIARTSSRAQELEVLLLEWLNLS